MKRKTFHGLTLMIMMYTMLWLQNSKITIRKEINCLTAMGEELIDFS